MMGLSTILILLCHSCYCITFPNIVRHLIIMCNLGVDVFLVLSGIGLFYSLGKRNTPLRKWYIIRLSRIGMPFLIFIGAEYLFSFYINELSFSRFLLALTTIGYWFHHEGAWFVSLLIPLYLLSPIICYIRKLDYGLAILGCAIVIFMMIGAIDTPNDNECFLFNFTNAIERVPSFLVGFIIAPWVMDGRKINSICLCVICFLLKFLLSKYLGILGSASGFTLVLPICILFGHICIFLDRLKRQASKLAMSFLTFMGRISLESYLANSLLLHIALAYSFRLTGVIIYILIVLVGTFMSIVVNNISSNTVNKIREL